MEKLVVIAMFVSGMLVFSMNRKHLLLMLLSLEFIMLSVFFNLVIYLSNMDFEYFFLMVYIIFCVCEGVLGLSILVSLIRTHSNDYFKSFSVLW
uniref:NADH-ubiquinone oxidoreductase chain 4L n=1 Tax=Ischalia sp. BMNH 840493 TaxID=904169 RepID=I7FDF9_9CUCU|nr:NADH dehydrogenase subunit 4L [Ischalia sp. BMNH 840493]